MTRFRFTVMDGERVSELEEPVLPDDIRTLIHECVDLMDHLEWDAMKESDRAVHCARAMRCEVFHFSNPEHHVNGAETSHAT
jgi:hypothetical protein